MCHSCVSRNPLFLGSWNSLDSRSPIAVEDEFHGNDDFFQIYRYYILFNFPPPLNKGGGGGYVITSLQDSQP